MKGEKKNYFILGILIAGSYDKGKLSFVISFE